MQRCRSSKTCVYTSNYQLKTFLCPWSLNHFSDKLKKRRNSKELQLGFCPKIILVLDTVMQNCSILSFFNLSEVVKWDERFLLYLHTLIYIISYVLTCPCCSVFSNWLDRNDVCRLWHVKNMFWLFFLLYLENQHIYNFSGVYTSVTCVESQHNSAKFQPSKQK